MHLHINALVDIFLPKYSVQEVRFTLKLWSGEPMVTGKWLYSGLGLSQCSMIAPPLLLHSSACLKYKTTAFLKNIYIYNNNKSSKEQMDLARNRICYLGLFVKELRSHERLAILLMVYWKCACCMCMRAYTSLVKMYTNKCKGKLHKAVIPDQ